MATDPTSRTILTLVGAALFLWFIYLVREALPPFLIAFGLATLMDPVLDRLQRRGMRRGIAVALTFITFLALFIGAMVILLPIAFAQSNQLVGKIPAAYDQVRQSIDAWARDNITLLQRLHFPTSTQEIWDRYHREIAAYLQALPKRIFAAFQASAGRLIWIVIIPIVTLYLMVDIDRIRARAFHLVPDAHRDTWTKISGEVGRIFASYLRGLFIVCVGFGTALGLILAIVMPQYAIILGLVGGVLYAVPYIGPLATIAIAVIVAWATRGQLPYAIGVGIGVLALNQVFDQIITPRVLGRLVGLHPVLSIFALMVGGSLFGLIGMLLAVPVAASVQQVLGHFYPRLLEPLISPEEPARVPVEASSAR